MKNINRKKSLMVVAGGTGGHIYPSLSLINNMKNYNYVIITDERGKKYYLNFLENKTLNYKIFSHKVTSPSKKNIINILVSLFQILISFLKSIFLILFQKPNLIIGFGGYPSIAPMLAAKICNVPSIIHEQNAVLGRGNRLLGKISNVLATSFVKTKKIENVKNVIFTGNPVRKPFEEIGKNDFVNSIKNKPFTILIYGGSLGSTFFSKQLTLMICSLPEKIRKDIKIIQQVRKEDMKSVKQNYKIHNINSEISSFYHDIAEKFQLANLIITRSGGSTVAEILASCRPAIFIPLPSSLDNHQFENAKLFVSNNCGWLFDQINNNKNDFEKLIIKFFKNPQTLIKTSKKIRELSNELSKLRNGETSSEFLSQLIFKMMSYSKKEIKNTC